MLQNQSHSKTFNVVKIRQTQAAEYSEDSRFSSSEYYLLVRVNFVLPKAQSRRCIFVKKKKKSTSPVIKRRTFGVSDEIQTADFLNIR